MIMGLLLLLCLFWILFLGFKLDAFFLYVLVLVQSLSFTFRLALVVMVGTAVSVFAGIGLAFLEEPAFRFSHSLH